jgi:hypothetical protein
MRQYPSLYVVFFYDRITNQLLPLTGGNDIEIILDELDYIESHTFFSVYKYKNQTTYFEDNKKANTYELFRNLEGLNSPSYITYTPPRFAIKFDDEYSWFFK